MDINTLLKGVDCGCGKHHSCAIEYVYIEKNAISKLDELCKDYNNILLVADENTFEAAGKKTVAVIGNKIKDKVVFDGKTLLIPDETAIRTVTDKIAGTDLIIGVGSGVIQDICKYIAFNNNLPYFIVVTAPSMDGYASDGAAMITNGMKTTYKAGLPKAIIADTEVIKNAPLEMLQAGYGDIVGKISALLDWKLANVVTGEYFCEYIHNTTNDMINKVTPLAKDILARDEDAVKTLMEALVVVGIMMSFAGSSRPASGSEHHLAHFFEITGIVNNTDYFPHGIDVAYATVFMTGLRERIKERTDLPIPCKKASRDEYEKQMQRVYGKVAGECIKLQDELGRYAEDRYPIYKEKEAEIMAIIKQSPSATRVERMVNAIGLSVSDFYRKYGDKHITDAIKYAKDLKDRYTFLWMYYDLYGTDYQY